MTESNKEKEISRRKFFEYLGISVIGVLSGELKGCSFLPQPEVIKSRVVGQDELKKLTYNLKENPLPMKDNRFYISVIIGYEVYKKLEGVLKGETPEEFIQRHIVVLSGIISDSIPGCKGIELRRILILKGEVNEPGAYDEENPFADSDGVLNTDIIENFVVKPARFHKRKIGPEELDKVLLHELGHCVLRFSHWEVDGLIGENREEYDSTVRDVPYLWRIYQGRGRNDRRGVMSYSDRLSPLEREFLRWRLKNDPHNYEEYLPFCFGDFPCCFSPFYRLILGDQWTSAILEIWRSEEQKGRILMCDKRGEYRIDPKGEVVIENPFSDFSEILPNSKGALLLKLKGPRNIIRGIRWLDAWDFVLGFWLKSGKTPGMKFNIGTESSDPYNFDWTVNYF